MSKDYERLKMREWDTPPLMVPLVAPFKGTEDVEGHFKVVGSVPSKVKGLDEVEEVGRPRQHIGREQLRGQWTGSSGVSIDQR